MLEVAGNALDGFERGCLAVGGLCLEYPVLQERGERAHGEAPEHGLFRLCDKQVCADSRARTADRYPVLAHRLHERGKHQLVSNGQYVG